MVDTARDREITFMAASFAHYALASLIPLFVVVIALLSYVGAAGAVVSAVESNVPESVAGVLQPLLSAEAGHGAAGVVGLLLALWSGLKVFRGLSTAFAEVYDTGDTPSLVDELKDGVVVLGLILLAFVLLSATSIALTYGSFEVPFPRVVGNLTALVVVAVALLPLYYVLPPVPVTVRHTLPGAVFTAVGWLLLQIAFRIYASGATRYQAYGLLGALVLFVLFLYFAGIILLVGAVVNVVLARPTPLATLPRKR
ncbi:ribonuclease BN [Candidatus Halobonum tyrrellensis G22]|uniref:Ribonuclease BN n=1 Tax=Candidatus Halobonum tyrrellensis G22 TaxID=1324957 RepID=V4J1B6_9EURY|nr:ribonuclease BN [Candidatus Halobonum tyrrellensis G22]